MLRKLYYLLLVILSGIGIYFTFNITIIPTKDAYLIGAIYFLSLLIVLILLFRKNKILKFLGLVFSIFIIILSIGIYFVYNRTNDFFNKITNVEYEKSNYAIIALKDTEAEKLDDIKNIGIYKNELDKNYSLALEELDNKITLNKKEYSGLIDLVTDLLEKHIEAILINENYIDIIEETTTDFKERIKYLDTISIETIKEKKELENEIKKLGNFNIYISGIDTYGEISTVSRSDVNMIATINFKDGKILLTNTPRDYYVQLAGTTGLKDKLTHAGVYGIDVSMKTY